MARLSDNVGWQAAHVCASAVEAVALAAVRDVKAKVAADRARHAAEGMVASLKGRVLSREEAQFVQTTAERAAFAFQLCARMPGLDLETAQALSEAAEAVVGFEWDGAPTGPDHQP